MNSLGWSVNVTNLNNFVHFVMKSRLSGSSFKTKQNIFRDNFRDKIVCLYVNVCHLNILVGVWEINVCFFRVIFPSFFHGGGGRFFLFLSRQS